MYVWDQPTGSSRNSMLHLHQLKVDEV